MINIRKYTPSDYNELLAILDDCYAGMDIEYGSEQDFTTLSNLFADGQLLAECDGRVAGVILSLPVRFDDFNVIPVMAQLYDPAQFSTLSKDADSLFALEILVKNDYKRRGIGRSMNKAITEVLTTHGFKAFIGVSRMPGYAAHKDKLTAEEYISKVVGNELGDPSLSYNCSNNMLPARAIAGYFPPDVQSAGYGALVIQQSPAFANAIKDVLAGKQIFSNLPTGLLLNSADLTGLNESLAALPFTFNHPAMPNCWGKAFENYATMADYLAPEPGDDTVAALCRPIVGHLRATLHSIGIATEVLVDDTSNSQFTCGDFRIAQVESGLRMLHIDDITVDGSIKPDFEIPLQLAGKEYNQCSLIIHLDQQGDSALRVYNKKYQPEDNSYIMENGWQFSEDVVAGISYKEIFPKTGDTYIFSNHCYHDIPGGKTDSTWKIFSLYLLFVPVENKAYLYI